MISLILNQGSRVMATVLLSSLTLHVEGPPPGIILNRVVEGCSVSRRFSFICGQGPSSLEPLNLVPLSWASRI